MAASLQTDTYSGLLATIIACPDDDTPRLVLADWLEENGQEWRAEFIRVQIELAANAPAYCEHKALTGKRCRWCALRCRERELRDANWRDWIITYTGSLPGAYPAQAFHRGFVEAISCPWPDWSAHADAIMAATPLRDVRLTTRPDIGTGIKPRGFSNPQYVVAGKTLSIPMAWFGVTGFDWYKAVIELRWPSIKFELPPSQGPSPLQNARNTWNNYRDMIAMNRR